MTAKDEVQDFLDKQEVDYVKASGASKELVVRPCPFCGTEKDKFYVNRETGLFDCKICGEKGNFFKLKKAYGVVDNVGSARDMIGKEFKPLDMSLLDTYQSALRQNGNARDYLATRGFAQETIDHFKLGYKADHDGEWIAIPHFQEGKLWNFKFRRFAGGEKDFRRIPGQPTTLFNIDGLNHEKKAIVIVESETDAMAAWQMGVTNVVSGTAGAASYSPSWNKVMSQFATVYIALNTDAAGEKGARSFAEKIGMKKCRKVTLPVNDVNEMLQDERFTSTDFQNLFGKSAEKFEVKDVSSASDIVARLDDWYSGATNGIIGHATGFSQLDHITRGLKGGDLIILSGDSGIGKTTFLNNIVNHQVQLDKPTFGFYLEGQIEYYFSRMVGGELGMPYESLDKDPVQFEEIKKQMSELPFHYFSGSQGGLTIEYMKEFIPAVVALYDVEVLVLDNLQKLVRGGDAGRYLRESEAVSVLKDLAVDLNIPVILISHVRKRDPNQKIITMQDMKGSSTIFQDADQVWILQPVKEQYYLTIEKNRMGEDGVNIPFEFDKTLGVFSESGATVDASSLGRAPRTRED